MENSKKISLKEIKEAIKQADANINFENVKNDLPKHKNNTKTLKRSNNYGKRPLG